ncbi:MAG TPA: hypothetical protein VGG10_11575 [Rhizomicrobium sp.]|jgi:hypothetical protein
MSLATDSTATTFAKPRWLARPLAVGVCAIAAFAIHASLPLNHDVAWIMEGANRMLGGAQFGRDIVDVNPPLAWWLSCIPAAFARLTGIHLAQASVLFTLGYGLIAIALTDAARAVRSAAMLATLAFVLLLMPGYDFGQREHLMLMSAVPYLAAVAARAERRPIGLTLAIAIGLFAGAGFCLKPYFLLVPIFAESWLAWQRRSLFACLRPDFVPIPLFGAAYTACIVLFAPDYLHVVAPEAVVTYWALNASFAGVLRSSLIAVLPYGLFFALVLAEARKRPSPTAAVMFVGACGALVGAVLQMKGFTYHLLPAASLFALACFWENGETSTGKLARLAAIGLVTIAALPAFQQLRDAVSSKGTAARVAALSDAFVRYAGRGGTVYAFVTSPRDIHPAILASGTRWASDACCLYHLPAAIRADERPVSERARIQAVAARQVDHVLGDLARDHPAVIVVDAWPAQLGFGGRDFDYLRYLSQDPRFARLWRGYSERQAIGGYRVFVANR